MSRIPRATDFPVEVEGIGRFVFAKRTMADEIAIQRKYAEIVGGVEPTPWLQSVGAWLAVLPVLTVSAPEGWGDVEEFDPNEEETFERLSRVYMALRERENSFRGGKKPASQGSGA